MPPNEANNNLLLLSTVLCQGNLLRVLSRSKKKRSEFLCKYNQIIFYFVNLQIIWLWDIFVIKICFCPWSSYSAFLCVFSSYKIWSHTVPERSGQGHLKAPRSMAGSLCFVVFIFRIIGIRLKPRNEDSLWFTKIKPDVIECKSNKLW